MKSGGLVISEFTPFIYEAAYIGLKTGFFEKTCLSKTITTALERILSLAGIENSAQAQAFLEENQSRRFEISAKDLLGRINIKEEFFSSLDEASAFVYHSMNFEVSENYGINIASCFDFSHKRIADIGGSSGGLLSGIKKIYPNISGYVFDKDAACAAGEILTDEIGFERFDFFTDSFDSKNFDCIVLSNVLHDWNDENCEFILKNLLKNILPKQKLIIHEDILLDDGLAPRETLMYGLRLSINVFEARQRKISEIMTLAKKANGNGRLGFFKTFGPLSLAVIEF